MSAINASKQMTIELDGYITAANTTGLQAELKDAISNPSYARFLVDMSGVEFLDSAGLMALVSAFRLAQSLGKRLNICSIPPSVKIIFELTQLDRVLEIYENREAFEASLASSKSEMAA